ncbi:DUF6332 family protein [Streptomyces sp. NBC_00876]|uniref:DUF6332 family protein n=1 Tax=Streptomyces sp. NBC_00876 TaxID=2975853 RepID=UPI003866EE16|nr:DUF6332 family protein [Streptomyces sp. NBC_00876]
MTVEIGFAVVTGGLLAVAAFITVCAPVLFLAPHGDGRSVLLVIAAAVAGLVFMGRVVDVLRRYGHRDRFHEVGRRGPVPPGQPSQPGRTSPDS